MRSLERIALLRKEKDIAHHLHMRMAVDAPCSIMIDSRIARAATGAKAMKSAWSRSFHGRLSFFFTPVSCSSLRDVAHLRGARLARHLEARLGDAPGIGGAARLVARPRSYPARTACERLVRENGSGSAWGAAAPSLPTTWAMRGTTALPLAMRAAIVQSCSGVTEHIALADAGVERFALLPGDAERSPASRRGRE